MLKMDKGKIVGGSSSIDTIISFYLNLTFYNLQWIRNMGDQIKCIHKLTAKSHFKC